MLSQRVLWPLWFFSSTSKGEFVCRPKEGDPPVIPHIIWSYDLRDTMKDDFRQIQPNLLDITSQVASYSREAKPEGFFVFGDRPEDAVPSSKGTLEKYSVPPSTHPAITTSIDWLTKALGAYREVKPPIKFGEDPSLRPPTEVGSRAYGSAALDVVYHFAVNYKWDTLTSSGPFIHVLFTDSVPRVRGSSGTIYENQPLDLDDVLSDSSSYIDVQKARERIDKLSNEKKQQIVTIVITQVDQDGGNVNPAWEQLMREIGLQRFHTGFINVENTLFVKEAVDAALDKAFCEYIDDHDPSKTTTTTTTQPTTTTTTPTTTTTTPTTTTVTTTPTTTTTTTQPTTTTTTTTTPTTTSSPTTTTTTEASVTGEVVPPDGTTTTTEEATAPGTETSTTKDVIPVPVPVPTSTTTTRTPSMTTTTTSSEGSTSTSSEEEKKKTGVIIGAAGGGLAGLAALGYYLFKSRGGGEIVEPEVASPPNTNEQTDRATLIHIDSFA